MKNNSIDKTWSTIEKKCMFHKGPRSLRTMLKLAFVMGYNVGAVTCRLMAVDVAAGRLSRAQAVESADLLVAEATEAVGQAKDEFIKENPSTP